MQTQMILSSGSGGLKVRAVNFDGTNDYLARSGDFTSPDSDLKTGIVSLWIKPTDISSRRIMGGTGSGNDRLAINLDADGTVKLALYNRSSPILASITSNAGVITTNNWHHIIFAWDATNAEGFVYVDGVDETLSLITNNTTASMTNTNWYVGVQNNSFPNNKFYGDMAQFYFNDAEYLDISNPSNLQKFITPAGKPVDLGSDGSVPTGNDPILFLNLADGDSVSTFANNKGYGGGMTLTGSLTEALTNPSL